MDEATEGRDYEKEAREQGWTDDWKGDPERFKSAEQFVKDGESIPALLKSKVERVEQKNDDLAKRVDELLETNKQFNEMTQRTLAKERKEKEKVIKELEQVRKQAITDGDGDAFDRADKQLDDLKADDPAPASGPQDLNPLAKKWLEANPWYETNATLRRTADGAVDELLAQGYTGQAYFDALTDIVKQDHPDEFSNKNRSKPNGVEAGAAATVSKEHSFANLPKEAKESYKQWAKDIPDFTKEQFVEQYDWD